MICPNCHHEVPDGYLLCENCGCEIKIVPDFEPEIESSITESLSGIADELAPEKLLENEKINDDDLSEEDFFKEHTLLNKKLNPLALAGVFLSAAVIVILLYLIISSVYKNNSASYQLKRAEKAASSGDYDSALNYIKRAGTLGKESPELLLEEADIYSQIGFYDNAENILLSTINDKALSQDEKKAFYERLIKLYIDNDNLDKINPLISGSDDDEIKEVFNDYMALPPIFSIPTGNYAEVMELNISSNTSGRIFYTLDESIPSMENGTLYTGGIILRPGEYTFKAIFFNDIGISSDVSQSFYLIDLEAPSEPMVTPESGNISSPLKISVSADEDSKVYYTTNGRIPDEENGILYEEPIDIPLGNSNFSFIAIGENGLSSEVIKRSYSFNLNTNVSPELAVKNVLIALKDANITVDLNGAVLGGAGRYAPVFNSVIEIPGMGYYYRLDEYLVKNEQSVEPTGLLYAVEVYTGMPFRLLINASGEYELMTIGKK